MSDSNFGNDWNGAIAKLRMRSPTSDGVRDRGGTAIVRDAGAVKKGGQIHLVSFVV
ncbi:hypothetical protein [Lyngbya sp. CCY1209]|uniref:hypothetical protein n=1 Tax=Lyngbya sp. CCY1209 TaxID=2886103 RepID=UPI002D206F69|nr:hypothetical protein [Lyngbya sp. CCY1209]MEB3886469.1 hypothetical protein [Lyngbya sp. CCY1209]